MKHLKKFENFNNLNESHSEESETIWFKKYEELGFDALKDMAINAFRHVSGSYRIINADDENDLWNALDYLNLFDNFTSLLNEEEYDIDDIDDISDYA
jgi:hypothetical protein